MLERSMIFGSLEMKSMASKIELYFCCRKRVVLGNPHREWRPKQMVDSTNGSEFIWLLTIR